MPASELARNNSKVIDKAVKRLQANADTIIEKGMKRLLADAMAYALDVHDAEHFGHRTTEDSYGWALVKRGRVVALETNKGKHGKGEAERQLRDVASGVSKDGWVGIVLASMTAQRDTGKPIIFVVDYEIGVLNFTADEIKDYFNVYFKPIA